MAILRDAMGTLKPKVAMFFFILIRLIQIQNSDRKNEQHKSDCLFNPNDTSERWEILSLEIFVFFLRSSKYLTQNVFDFKILTNL